PPSPRRPRWFAVRSRNYAAPLGFRHQPQRRLEARSAPFVRCRQDAALPSRSAEGASTGSLPAPHARQPHSRFHGEAGDAAILIGWENAGTAWNKMSRDTAVKSPTKSVTVKCYNPICGASAKNHKPLAAKEKRWCAVEVSNL